MGKWQNTAYVHCADLSQIADGLKHIFKAEGFLAMSKPAEHETAPHDPMQYGNSRQNDMWSVAFFPGAEDWTVIKTAPYELLCEAAPRARHPRLADLSQIINHDALQVNLYDGTDLVLVECSAVGRYAISGFFGQQDDPAQFHDFRIKKFEAGIQILSELPGGVNDVFYLPAWDGAQKLAHLLAGANAGYCENSVQIEYLIPHRELKMPGFQTLYFRSSTKQLFSSE